MSTCCLIITLGQKVESSDHLYNLIGSILDDSSMKDILDGKINKTNSVLHTSNPETTIRLSRAINGQSINGKKAFTEPLGAEI